MCAGGCGGSTTTYSAPYVAVGNSPQLSHGECAGIALELLNMFLNLVNCVQAHNLYGQINVSPTEIDSAKTLLSNWITVKQADPDSCEYMDQLPGLQVIINKIVSFGRC